MYDSNVSRAELLIEQKRYKEAEKILKDLLTQDASNAYLLYLLAEIYLQQDKYKIAEETINHAIGISPDSPNLYYIKSRVYLLQNKHEESESSIIHCISLDPNDSDYLALYAHIKLAQKQFELALEIANKALEIEPENILALNTRSSALLKLKRADESFATIEGALREDPNNPYTHANYGWGLLEKGEHKKALEHFKESLKIDPANAYARSGMVEALKARYLPYKLFLQYTFWMSNKTSKMQWAIILGLYFGTRALRSIASTNPSLSPYLTPIIIALVAFAFSTWVMEPISNLFLRLNKYGKFLLNKKEKICSSAVGICLLILLSAIPLMFILRDGRYILVAFFGFAMMVPCSRMLSSSKYGPVLLIYTLAMAVVGMIGIAVCFNTGELLNPMTTIFGIGFLAFQLLANYILLQRQ